MSAPVETVVQEAAAAEFDRWAQAMDLVTKFDASEMEEKDAADFAKKKKTVIDAIRFGRLVVSDAGEFVFTPQLGNTERITFHEPDGAALMAIDRAKQNEGIKKTHMLLAAVCGVPDARFATMKQRDLTVCYAIVGLLAGG